MSDGPCGSADVSATAFALSLPPSGVVSEPPPEGLIVGNRPDALPPGLSVDPEPFRNGRFPTVSGEVTLVAGGGAVVVVVPDVDDDEDDDEDEEEDDDDEDDVELAGAVTVTGIVAAGAFERLAPPLTLPVTVSFTDVTEVAVVGTVTWASSDRSADAESTAPRLHDVLPSLLPQPKLNAVF